MVQMGSMYRYNPGNVVLPKAAREGWLGENIHGMPSQRDGGLGVAAHESTFHRSITPVERV
jgi:hypothetical protein